ncbi:hypothetical protein TNCV_2471481 [Trichonephila clavipes]|nr:hypothetical protein TNCV_2471481 [Trichonephila clavipes]
MSRSGGQSEESPPVSPSKLCTNLSTHCSRDERPSPGTELGVEVRYFIKPLQKKSWANLILLKGYDSLVIGHVQSVQPRLIIHLVPDKK